MRSFNISLGLTNCNASVGIKVHMAQVDITKYSSDDLFSVKPIMTQEYLEENQKENEPEISSHVEQEIANGMEYGLMDNLMMRWN